MAEKRCKATIYKRDTYRYTGRVKSGFEMHYTEEQCSRRSVQDSRCWQHLDRWLTESPFAEEYMPERQSRLENKAQ